MVEKPSIHLPGHPPGSLGVKTGHIISIPILHIGKLVTQGGHRGSLRSQDWKVAVWKQVL